MRHESVLVALCLFLFGFGEVVSIIPLTFAQSQALVPFVGTLKRSYAPIGFGLDLGQINYAFSQTQVSWQDGAGHNMSFNVPKLSGVGLSLATSQNSTTIDYHLSGTVLTHATVIDVFLKQQKWNYKITIQGTISGLSGTLPLTLALPSSVIQQPAFPSGLTQTVCIDHLCFDWSDSPSCTFAASTLTCNIGASFKLDPLALDNTVQATCAGATSCTTLGAIEGLNDILIVECADLSNADDLTASSTPAQTWMERKSVAQTGLLLDEWYAVSTASQSYTFKCTKSGAAGNIGVRGFGISGADTSTIFDPNVAVPCTQASASTNSPTCTLSTTNTNDFIYGLFTPGASTTLTAGSGYTLVGSTNPNAEYKIVSAPQTNLAVSATWGANALSNMIGDAVFATQNTVTTTKSTTTTTSTTSTTTVNVSTQFPWFILAPLFIAFAFIIIGMRKFGR